MFAEDLRAQGIFLKVDLVLKRVFSEAALRDAVSGVKMFKVVLEARAVVLTLRLGAPRDLISFSMEYYYFS